MLEYRVGGLTVATAGSDNDAAAILWNPHTTKPLWVAQIAFSNDTTASAKVTLCRTTTRGTQVVTITPDIDNHTDHLLAPPTGAVLDVDWSAEPTKASPDLGAYNTAAAIGAGKIWDFRTAINPVGIRVLPGAGFGVIAGAAAAVPVCGVEFLWYE